MTEMICSKCNQYGIYWKNLTTMPYTVCPRYGGKNCQRPEIEEESSCEDLPDIKND